MKPLFRVLRSLSLFAAVMFATGPIGPLFGQIGSVTNVVGSTVSVSGTNTTIFFGGTANFTPGRLWIQNPGGGNPFRANAYYSLNGSTNRFLLNSYTNSGALATNELFSLLGTNLSVSITLEIIATNNVNANYQR